VEEGAKPEQSADPSEFIAGFLTGALTGAALAMLLTPQSGEDLRTVLRETAQQLSNRVRDTSASLEQPEPPPAADIAADPALEHIPTES
jgi:YtxH-like protein